jgi:selenocysteine lyase/cysteine desulfurase
VIAPTANGGWRDDFVDFEGVAWLNTAYVGAMPRVALAAAQTGLGLKAQPYRIRDEDFFELPDAYRAEVAALIGADARDVAVADSTIHVVNTLALGLDWKAGDEVLIPAGEFPSNRFPWHALAAKGVVVREVEIADCASAAERFEAASSPKTRVVSVGWVHYSSGRRLDLDAVGEVARRRGALFVVDGSQGLGGLPFTLDPARRGHTRCDALACSGYKWLLGPYGLGFGWFSPELQERLAAPRVNWFAVKGARDFARLARCGYELEPGARRFDVNETASFANLPAGTTALGYVRAIGAETVAAHVAALHDRIVAGLPARFRVVSERDPRYRSNLLCLAGERPDDAEGAHAELRRRDVRVSCRDGALRVSAHLCNDESDVERLLEGLEAFAEIAA